jgi:ABC-type Fe3+ transport system permease subunit
MANKDHAARAEQLSRRRARMLPFLAVIYLSQQLTFFTALDPAGHDTARYAKTGAWLILTLLLLAGIATRGFWFEKPQTRDLLDDESTRANRLDALRFGFIVAMLAAVGVVFLAMIEPLRANEAAQLVLSLGLGAALIRFGMLEKRAHRDG